MDSSVLIRNFFFKASGVQTTHSLFIPKVHADPSETARAPADLTSTSLGLGRPRQDPGCGSAWIHWLPQDRSADMPYRMGRVGRFKIIRTNQGEASFTSMIRKARS